MRPLAVLLCGAGALAPALALAAGSIRCGARLVSEGMPAAEVLAICGEPDLRDVWGPPYGLRPGYLAPTEEWTYNFGSNQLLRVLRLRNGRVERIDSEGYGFAPQHTDGCSLTEIRRGMSKYRLLQRCGAPLTRMADYVFYPQPPLSRHPDLREGYSTVTPVYREQWTYNFGARRLQRLVILENGRVADVDTGRRGFDP